jgi:hypothetical protein
MDHHLGSCGACAEEALLLRDAVALLHPAENLDLDPALRARVLEASLARRPPRVPVPGWTAPYDAETARLDALLQDIGAEDWHAPVRLRWYENDLPLSRWTTVTAVLGHLLSVDGLVAAALGLDDPPGTDTLGGLDAVKRTETYGHAAHLPPTSAVRTAWRDQSHRLVRTASFTAGNGIAATPVPYGDFVLPLRDALLERAFECWIHASDIAAAVDYPYGPPVPRHMHRIIDLTARRLPDALATRRGGAPARPGSVPPTADGAGRILRLEIEGAAGGEWLIALDALRTCSGAGSEVGTGADTGAGGRTGHHGREVAHIALDDLEFCRLAAGHVSPEEATAGSTGDRTVIMDTLSAVSSLSRM